MSLYIETYFKTARMLVEAQTVVAMRMLGAVGLVQSQDDEGMRMVTEKQAAMLEVSSAMWGALADGRNAVEVYDRVLTPIHVKTGANSRRLTERHGPH